MQLHTQYAVHLTTYIASASFSLKTLFDAISLLGVQATAGLNFFFIQVLYMIVKIVTP